MAHGSEPHATVANLEMAHGSEPHATVANLANGARVGAPCYEGSNRHRRLDCHCESHMESSRVMMSGLQLDLTRPFSIAQPATILNVFALRKTLRS